MMVEVDSKLILFVTVALFMVIAPVAGKPRGRRGKLWEGVETALAATPDMMKFYQGKTSLGDMTWLQINHLVKGVISQMEQIDDGLLELKEEVEGHGVAYICTVVVVGLLVAGTVILICLEAGLRRYIMDNREWVFQLRKQIQNLKHSLHLCELALIKAELEIDKETRHKTANKSEATLHSQRSTGSRQIYDISSR